jgi:ubiquinone/menaquinone biosynthesis C-methylase UbiE
LIKNLSHELALAPSRDEHARQEFVSTLRNHVLDDMAASMHKRYEATVKPDFERAHGRPPVNGEEVHDAMLRDSYFCFYSAARYNAQEMVHHSVIPLVDRNMEELNDRAHKLRESQDVGGTLTLDPGIEIPRSVSSIDVHLFPGSYHSEYADNDASTGALYDNTSNVFAFDQMGKNSDDIGHTFSNYIRIAHPNFKPDNILDVGCTIGHNTIPWAQTFPDAHVTGVDVAPALLRYGSARAKSMGRAVDFKQMNSTALDYPDASVDVVFSSMFLHELPLKDIRAYFKEAYRVLKPGGLFLTMELPPNNKMEAYDRFYLDWDCYYNKEPYYKPFRDQDYVELCTDAGFPRNKFFEVVLPRYTYTDETEFTAKAMQPPVFDHRTGRLSEELQWYGFGIWKPA